MIRINKNTVRIEVSHYDAAQYEHIPGIKVFKEFDTGRWFADVPRTCWELEPFRAMHDQRRNEFLMPSGSYMSLYSHQKEAVDFALRQGWCLNASSMGTGKTRTAIAAAGSQVNLRSPRHQPVVITGPKYLRQVWQDELRKVGRANEGFAALEGMEMKDLPEVGWYFVHYDIISAWWSRLYRMRPVSAIVDEAHLLKNGRSQRTKSVSMAVSAVPFRQILTGTPVPNHVGEFHTLLNLTTGPWTWGNYQQFTIRYAGAYHDGYGYRLGSPTNIEELQERMKCCYIRRTLDDIGADVPSITRQPIVVDLDEDTRRVYEEQLMDAGLEDFRSGFKITSDRAIKALSNLRKITAKAKEDVTLQEAVSSVQQGESVVVFLWQRTSVTALAKKLRAKLGDAIPVFEVHGGLKQEARDESVRSFQAEDEMASLPRVVRTARVMVATYGSLGVGVTLHRARIVILSDLDWVPAVMLQAEARCRRLGSVHSSVIAKWILGRNTIDEDFYRLIQGKADHIAVAGDADPQDLSTLLHTELGIEDPSEEYLCRWREFTRNVA